MQVVRSTLGAVKQQRRTARIARVAVAAMFCVLAFAGPLAAPSLAQDDALHHRVLSQLQSFIDWLQANNARGFVGEIGWPDQDHGGEAQQWNDLAEQWYEKADAAGLWVNVWATGEWWGNDYKLAAYEDLTRPAGVDTPNTQAPVIEAHPSTASYERCITDAGGDFNGRELEPRTKKFSNHNPGKYDTNYHYDGAATFQYLASRGIDCVRIEFRWEAIQRKLGGPLNATELARFDKAIQAARDAGLLVILDMHNFGAYYLWNGTTGVRRAIGTKKLPIKDFQDVWRRLSNVYKDQPNVYYGLMNEPVGLKPKGSLSAAEVWEKASQAALQAVRDNGDDKVIMVSGYHWSPLADWAKYHPDGWITDPANNFLYEAHHYWDTDQSGSYVNSYAQEVQNARFQGY